MKPRSHAPLAPADARYQIERKLGEGAAGAVYLARDLETGELLALKKLFRMDAKSVLRLKREFRSLQVLNHPHIVKLYDMGQGADAWFLTMEYLDGCDLTSYVGASSDGALSPRLAVIYPRPRQPSNRRWRSQRPSGNMPGAEVGRMPRSNTCTC